MNGVQVGGLSVINAIAGAYSENLPVICIVGRPRSKAYMIANVTFASKISFQHWAARSNTNWDKSSDAGGPNSNDFGTNRILHHTIGEPDFHQEMRYLPSSGCSLVYACISITTQTIKM